MKKINRFNKMADRVIIVTDSAIFKLDGCKKKFKNMKKAVHIKDVSDGTINLIVNNCDLQGCFIFTDHFNKCEPGS